MVMKKWLFFAALAFVLMSGSVRAISYNCNSQVSCELAIQTNASNSLSLFLTQDIINCRTDSCLVVPANSTLGLEFNCQNHIISNTSTQMGIWIYPGSNNVTIKNCKVYNFTNTGIYIEGNATMLYNVTLSSNSNGIYLLSSYANISYSNSSYNSVGLNFYGDLYFLTIIKNTFYKDNIGFSMEDGSRISNSTVDSNNVTEYGIRAWDICAIDNTNITSNNMSTSNPTSNGVFYVISSTCAQLLDGKPPYGGQNRKNIMWNNYIGSPTYYISYAIGLFHKSYLNFTKTSFTNIMGGPYAGGNFWQSYTGFDSDNDKLGDTVYVISTSPAVADFLPLMGTNVYGIVDVHMNSTGLLNYTYSAIPGQNETFNLTANVTGNNVNTTINFSKSGDLANTSRFIVFFQSNPIMLGDEQATNNLVTIQTNSTVTNGNYVGWLNWTNLNNTANNGSVQINITVSTQGAASIKFVNTSWVAAFTEGGSQTLSFSFWNKGTYNATKCNITYSGIALMAPGNSSFIVTNSTNVSVSVTFSGTPVIEYQPLTITCNATASSGTTTDSLSGLVFISALSGGGTGGSGSSTVIINNTIQILTCGDGVCSQGETIETCSADCKPAISSSAGSAIRYELAFLGISAGLVLIMARKSTKKRKSGYRTL